MKKLNKCSYVMARYLWKKWRKGDISESQINKIFTFNCACDIFGGWFADFYYDLIMP